MSLPAAVSKLKLSRFGMSNASARETLGLVILCPWEPQVHHRLSI